MNPKLEHRIEISVIAVLILFHIADFLEILPGDLDYVKKIISWSAVGYLFARASLSAILFGHKKARFDVAVILAYFLFIVKDLIVYAESAAGETVLFSGFCSFLLANALLIEKYCFYSGGILLLLLSLCVSLKFEVKEPSLMAVLHEAGNPPKQITALIARFFSIFLVLAAFFILVFNLAAEWLAIALDAPLIMLAILVYFSVFVVKRHAKFHAEHFIYKVGTTGEKFYKKIIGMFHRKNTLYLGVMGLLALHLLTDAGIFIVPYIIGLKDALYFGHLGESHAPLMHMLVADISSLGGGSAASLALIYFFNLTAMLFLLLLPAFVWYRFFRGKLLHVSRAMLALVSSSLLCFALMPVFFIKRMDASGLVGVDILTQSILNSHSIIDFLVKSRVMALSAVAALSVLVGAAVWILEFNKKIEKDVFIIHVLLGLAFLGFYLFYYFGSYYSYYISTTIILLKSNEFFIAFYFILFAIITMLFYAGGYLFFIYEVFKRHFFQA